MKKLSFLLLIPLTIILVQCKPKETGDKQPSSQFIARRAVDSVCIGLVKQYGEENKVRIEKGV